MISDNDRFYPKDPAEIVPLTFDFSNLTDTIVSPTVTITRVSGNADANPSAMLSGSPVVTAGVLVQKVTGGVSETLYKVRCQIDTSDGSRWVLVGKLQVATL